MVNLPKLLAFPFFIIVRSKILAPLNNTNHQEDIVGGIFEGRGRKCCMSAFRSYPFSVSAALIYFHAIRQQSPRQIARFFLFLLLLNFFKNKE